MRDFSTPKDVLLFAIELEEQMIRIFEFCCEKEFCKALSEIFARFAEEEKTHKRRLENILKSGQISFNPSSVADLLPENYLLQQDPCSADNIKDGLRFAMEIEKIAYRLYSDLSVRMTDPLLRSIFDILAQEESQHKLRFELAFDEMELKDK